MKANFFEAYKRLPGKATASYPEGAPFEVLMQQGEMSVEVFAPGSNADGLDRQQPHAQDELYFVMQGSGQIRIGDTLQNAEIGDAFFVPAQMPHCFENFSSDFAVWVVFYGAKTPQSVSQEIRS